MPSPRDQVFVSLMAYAGLRPGEAIALRWAHTPPPGDLLLVSESYSYGELRETKTGRQRTVSVWALVDDLQHLREVLGHDQHLVLPNRNGGYLDLRTWRRRIWRPAITRAGVLGITPYELRHTFASSLIDWGASPVEVAELMGNSPDVVWRHYAHAFEARRGGHKIDTVGGERQHLRAV
jgi:integrase